MKTLPGIQLKTELVDKIVKYSLLAFQVTDPPLLWVSVASGVRMWKDETLMIGSVTLTVNSDRCSQQGVAAQAWNPDYLPFQTWIALLVPMLC